MSIEWRLRPRCSQRQVNKETIKLYPPVSKWVISMGNYFDSYLNHFLMHVIPSSFTFHCCTHCTILYNKSNEVGPLSPVYIYYIYRRVEFVTLPHVLWHSTSLYGEDLMSQGTPYTRVHKASGSIYLPTRIPITAYLHNISILFHAYIPLNR